MAKIIDGKQISKDIKEELKQEVAELASQGCKCCLAVIQVGNDPASSVSVIKEFNVTTTGTPNF